MLPFLPALLLLILRGPSVLERAQAPVLPGCEAIYQHCCQRAAHGSANQALYKAVAELLRMLPAEQGNGTESEKPAAPRASVRAPQAFALREGFFECERSRDGPRAV